MTIDMSRPAYSLLVVLSSLVVGALSNSDAAVRSAEAPAQVVVGVIARNTAHTLENFFGYLEALDYPKDRVQLW